ncbi:GAF domain-containing protein [Roseivirga pacifica]|uniref:GAF domain-containing protein n=1 Tax=Roseivirga pacifica TaxID=1267423 RepID=UPI0020949D01|nr:GAF domain-containing protein [Roseivirga pacifica]MCO6359778.1 GAF domain-containing protein [Roseivirga pacifica]MCO6367148.1 GAF domain-containing protein [Roseivirga pacifica]MCO6370320.1 GAF domain-containing protein [Roseivirga pacifica]MCO6374805.1 GAF domain-containing protein [Roseivirga pacifica]MCO6380063.1 GAF domain-containing protein [Roseivirga pacifica]
MAEELIVSNTATKEEKYQSLIPQIEALVTGEPDLTANLANIAAALKYGMDFFWVGFYLVKDDELVLGPFQGPIACTRIRKGKGVCGTSWERAETVLVENVDEFPGHIACSSDSKSEIVLPAMKDGEVALILDVDSDRLSDFDATDQQYLEQLMRVVEGLL